MLAMELLANELKYNRWVFDDLEKKYNSKAMHSLKEYIGFRYVPVDLGFGVSRGEIFAALASWRMSKEVFCFDSELVGLLSSYSIEKLPIDLLYKLPYPCIYIELDNTFVSGKKIDGFFVHMNYFEDNNSKELRLLFVFDDNSMFCKPISLETDDLEEAFNLAFNNTSEYFFDTVDDRDDIDYLSEFNLYYNPELDEIELKMLVNKSIQMILYVFSENAEIKQYKPYKTIRTEQIRDVKKEIRTWIVGEEIGKRIRSFKTAKDFDNQEELHVIKGTHKSPSPHMRRSHWHHYWIGKKDGSEERKLILKWLDPTLINGKESNAIAEVHID